MPAGPIMEGMTRRPSTLPLALLFLLLLPGRGGAQRIVDLRPGDTIRVAQPGGLATQGIVLAASESAISFELRSSPDTLTLALNSLSRLDVARGRQTNVRGLVQGSGLGGLVGALAGAVWEFARAQRGVSVGERDVGIAAGIGGVAGMAVGGLLGAARPVTRWIPIRIRDAPPPDARISRVHPPAPLQSSIVNPS